MFSAIYLHKSHYFRQMKIAKGIQKPRLERWVQAFSVVRGKENGRFGRSWYKSIGTSPSYKEASF